MVINFGEVDGGKVLAAVTRAVIAILLRVNDM